MLDDRAVRLQDGAGSTKNFYNGMRPQAMTEDEDFSLAGIAARRREIWERTQGQANRLRGAVERGAPWTRGIDSMPQASEGDVPVGAPSGWYGARHLASQQALEARAPGAYGRPSTATSTIARMRIQEAQDLEQEYVSGLRPLSVTNPALMDVYRQATAAGVKVTPQDIANLTQVSILDEASNRMIDALDIRNGGQNANQLKVRNIMLSLQESSPVMASILPAYLDGKISEMAEDVATDPNWVQNSVSWVADKAFTSPASPLFYMDQVWQGTQHAIRAAQWNAYENQDSPEFAFRHLAYGAFSTDALEATANEGNFFYNKDLGPFDQQKLLGIQQEYALDPVTMGTLTEIAVGVNEGNTDRLTALIMDGSLTPEQYALIADFMNPRGDRQSDIPVNEVVTAIRMADRTNIGRMFVGEYADNLPALRNETLAYLTSDSLTAGAGLVDVTMLAGAPIRMITATRYAITKIAPTASRETISKALKSRKVGGMETNRARRYFQDLLHGLDEADKYEVGSVEYSDAMRKVYAQHREIPEDVILDFANTKNIPKVNGKRTMDGAEFVDEAGKTRRAGGFIDYIDDTNARVRATNGQVALDAKEAGEQYLIDRAIEAGIIDAGLDQVDALKMARANATAQDLERARNLEEGVIQRGSELAPSQRFRQYNKRDQVIPYTGIAGEWRRRTSRLIAANVQPAGRTRQTVDDYIKGFTPADTADALDSGAAAIVKADTATGGYGSGQVLADRISGLLSSIHNPNVRINLNTGEGGEQIYRLARAFYNKKTSSFIFDKFMRGTAGERRTIAAGLIRSAAASKGVDISNDDVARALGDLATGTRRGEMYSPPLTQMPSARMMQSTLRAAEGASSKAAKQEGVVARAQAELDEAIAQLDGARAVGDEANAAGLAKTVEKRTARLQREKDSLTGLNKQYEIMERRLFTALGISVQERARIQLSRFPAATQERVMERRAARQEVIDVPADEIVVPAVDNVVDNVVDDVVDNVPTPVVADDAVTAPTTPAAAGGKEELPLGVLWDSDGYTPSSMGIGSIAEVGFQEEIDGVLYTISVESAGSGQLSVKSYKIKKNDPWNKPGESGYGILMPDASVVYKDGEWVKGGGRMNRDNPPTNDALARTIEYAERARQRFDLSGYIDQAKVRSSLPDELRKAAPRYRDKTLRFGSDLDRALYIVRDGAKRSNADEKYMEWLRTQLPNVSDDQIRARGDDVAARVKKAAGEAGDNETVTIVARPVNSLDRGQPAQQILDDSGALVDEAPTPTVVDQAPPQRADQMALDAQGMTPPPERMTGGQMQEMPFDEAAPAKSLTQLRSDRVTELEALGIEGMNARFDELGSELIDQITTGPGYNRGVAEAMSKAARFLDEGREFDAAFALAQTEEAAGLLGRPAAAAPVRPAIAKPDLPDTYRGFDGEQPALIEKVGNYRFVLTRNGDNYEAFAYPAGKQLSPGGYQAMRSWRADGRMGASGSTVADPAKSRELADAFEGWLDNSLTGLGIDLDRTWAGYTPARDAIGTPPPADLVTNGDALVGREITDGVVFRGLDDEGRAKLEVDDAVISADEAWEVFDQTLDDLRSGALDIDDLPMASDGPKAPTLDATEEALAAYPTWQEFLRADPDAIAFEARISDVMERYPDGNVPAEVLAELTDLERTAKIKFAENAPSEAWEAYFRDYGYTEDALTAEMRQQMREDYYKDVYTAQPEDWQTTVGGAARDSERVYPNTRDWEKYGVVSRDYLLDLIDKQGIEEAWSWFHTGIYDAYRTNPDFVAKYDWAPKMREATGKGWAARYSTIPGEFDEFIVQAGTVKKGKKGSKKSQPRYMLKPPWSPSDDGLRDYIAKRVMDDQEGIERQVLSGSMADDFIAFMDSWKPVRTLDEADQTAAQIAAEFDQAVTPTPAAAEVADEAAVTLATPGPEMEVVPPRNPIPDPQQVDPQTIQGEVLASEYDAAAGVEQSVAANSAFLRSATANRLSRDAQAGGPPGSIGQLVDETGNSVVDVRLSRDELGRENALHMYQTARSIAIPSLDEIEAFARLNKGPIAGTVQSIAHGAMQKSTDFWSLATLYGFRFSIRSGVEDWMAYLLTGGAGRMGDAWRGRQGSQYMREAAPRIKVIVKKDHNGKAILDKAGNEVVDIVVPKNEGLKLANFRPTRGQEAASTSRLGMFKRNQRKIADWIVRGNNESMGGLLLPNLDKDKVVHAAAEIQQGNYEPMRGLIAEAVGRSWFGRHSLDNFDIEYLQDLGGTSVGTAMLRDIAEGGAQINSGVFRSLRDADSYAAGMANVEMRTPGRPVYFGEFAKVALSANEKADPMAHMFWHRGLQAIVRDDGPIGEKFVLLMHNPDEAKRVIADIIRKDDRMGYKEVYSMITDDASIDAFAARYYEDSLTYFLNKDGTINEKLRDKFVTRYTDKRGKERMTASWYVDREGGGKRLAVSQQELVHMDAINKPDYVLGRAVKNGIPMPTNLKGLSDRTWDWMGEQYARISREPIFIGNYMANRRIMRQSGYQDDLAQVFAGSRGEGAKVTDFDRRMARAVSSRQAMDASYAFTLNYIDNPANRSKLAWKVRNVARYYRATEDFARRASRLAKNYPDAYLKLALTYQILEDTAFTYRDDEGNLYFGYPGNDLLQDAFRVFGMIMQPTGFMGGTDSFMMGGLVKGIAPSTDPEQWAPTLTNPIITGSLAGFFNLFPSLKGLRTGLLGGYSQAGDTGNVMQDVVSQVMPAAIARAWKTMGPEEQEASMVSTGLGVLTSMYANGELDAVLDPAAPMTPEQFIGSDLAVELNRRAIATQATKLLLGYTMPSSVRQYQNDISKNLRLMGITGMKPVFYELVEKYDGDFAQAMDAWLRLDPDGDLLPFTVSKSEPNPNKIKGLTGLQPVDSVDTWRKDPKVQDLAEKFPDVYAFLAPRDGEFSWPVWAMIKATEFRSDKDLDTIIRDVFATQGQAIDTQLRNVYDSLIAEQDPNTDDGRKAISALNDEKSAAREQNRNDNPFWADKTTDTANAYSVEKLNISLTQTESMLNYMMERDGELNGSAALIYEAIATWRAVRTERDMITSNTEAAREQKKSMDLALEMALAEIGEQDDVAANFIDTVLSSSSLWGRVN